MHQWATEIGISFYKIYVPNSPTCDLSTYRICEQEMIRRASTLCTVSPEPLLIALKRSDVYEGSGQIVYTSSCDLSTYCICKQQMIRRACTLCTVSPEPLLIALKRRDVDEGSGQIVYTSSFDLRFIAHASSK